MQTIVISSRGNLTIPAKIRKEAGIEPNDILIPEVTSEGILLRPSVTYPIEIYTEERIKEFMEGDRLLGIAMKKKGLL